MQNSITLRSFLIYDIPGADRASGIAELSQMLEQGQLNHSIGGRLPLYEIVQAHEFVERSEVNRQRNIGAALTSWREGHPTFFIYQKPLHLGLQ
jgi:hypothetical protein